MGPRRRLPDFRGRSRGFSLVEALVALVVLAVVLAAFFGMFIRFQRAATVQADVASATEDLRHVADAVIRMVRMAGSGGLPILTPAVSGDLRPLTIDIVDNQEAGAGLVSSLTGEAWQFSSNRPAIPGTDVLRFRGVMTGPTFDIAPEAFSAPGRLSVSAFSPWTGRPQALEAPSSTNGRPFVIAMRSPLGIGVGGGPQRVYGQYRVVGVQGDAEIVTGPEGRAMHIDYNAEVYASLNPLGDSGIDVRSVVSGGFLDDQAFFIAENNYGEPSLYRARVKRIGGAVTAEEMVPNVCDLQVAFGCDVDGNGEVDGREWFLGPDRPEAPSADDLVSLVLLRLSLVSRTQSPDLMWRDTLAPLENSAGLADDERRFRYRATTVRVNLRSHPKVSHS